LRWPPLSATVYRHQRDYLYRCCNTNWCNKSCNLYI